jgi:hypothetical protein
VREQGTRDYGFHGNWAKKLAWTCTSWSNVSQVLASLKKLAMKFEPAQIIRKSSQVNASQRKLVVKRDASKCNLKLAMTCVLVWSGLYTCKNAQVVTGLQTSCYKSVRKLSTSCVPSCCNKCGTSCYQLVTTLMASDLWKSCSNKSDTVMI